jgi:hypothetical protein
MRLHNKTILDKPFIFDINPAYSTNAKTFSGSGFVVINQNYRNSALYNALLPFWLYFHYAPDAAYLKINPMVQLSIRERHSGQQKQSILFRQVIVSREKRHSYR